MSEPEIPTRPPNPLARCLKLGCGAPLLLLTLVIVLFLAVGPSYPRNKRKAFELLRRVGPEQVVLQARALMSQAPPRPSGRLVLPDRLPPALRSLEPMHAQITSTSVFVRIGGGGPVGIYGFQIDAEDVPGPNRIAPGLSWVDPYDAPEEMRGVPRDW
ncbi:MAG: hypothetical protein AB7N76_15090 [Planctomycetota bacterium]